MGQFEQSRANKYSDIPDTVESAKRAGKALLAALGVVAAAGAIAFVDANPPDTWFQRPSAPVEDNAPGTTIPGDHSTLATVLGS